MIRSLATGTVVIGLAGTALADEIHVPADHGSIQDAINTASDGDEIVVAPGAYNGAIDLLGKAVTLRSSDGADVTTIDAFGWTASVVRCSSGEGPDTVIDGFTVTGGHGSLRLAYRYGGGMYIDNCSPTVRNCVFTANTADGGGGMAILGGTSTISNCTFTGNGAGSTRGGGGVHGNFTLATFVDCRFIGNLSAGHGGGMMNLSSSPLLINCEFVSNTAYYGGAIRNELSHPDLVNCTVTGNSATVTGGGMYTTVTGATPIVQNSIFWNNGAQLGPEIIDLAGATTLIYNCNIEGGWGGNEGSNMDADPMFVDAAGGDFRLRAGSPCIDAGDNTALGGEITTDLAGADRFVDDPETEDSGISDGRAVVDLGAYEMQLDGDPGSCAGDADLDGDVGFSDLTFVLSNWGPCVDSCPADVDGSGEVAFDDVVQVLSSWGPCP